MRLRQHTPTTTKKPSVATLLISLRVGVELAFRMLYHLHLFFSAALHRRSGMEITGRTQSTGRDRGSPRIPHRLRMGSSTKCARRQCAPVDCRPNSAARGRESATWRSKLNGPEEWSTRRLRLLRSTAKLPLRAGFRRVRQALRFARRSLGLVRCTF